MKKEYDVKVQKMIKELSPLDEEIKHKQNELAKIQTDLEELALVKREMISRLLSGKDYQIPYKIGQLLSIGCKDETKTMCVKGLQIMQDGAFICNLTHHINNFGELCYEMILIPSDFEKSMISFAPQPQKHHEHVPVKFVRFI